MSLVIQQNNVLRWSMAERRGLSSRALGYSCPMSQLINEMNNSREPVNELYSWTPIGPDENEMLNVWSYETCVCSHFLLHHPAAIIWS